MIDFELVEPKDLNAWLSNERGSATRVVLEAHFSSIDHPLVGDLPVFRHLPGAIQIHPSYLEAGTNEARYYPFYDRPEDGNLLPHPELTGALERIGISPDTTVVVYGSEPDGTMAAARLIWGLMVAGVRTVRLLDGGIDAWVADGLATVNEIRRATEIRQAKGSGGREVQFKTWQARPEFGVTSSEVREISRLNGSAPGKLVDVRKPGEYDGTLKEYYPFFSKAGHIPNAVLQGDWNNLIDQGSQKLGPKLDEIRHRWLESGIIDEGVLQNHITLIFYCGTGWRSSIAFLVALLLGFRARNYDDGFYGWSWIDQNEIALGGPG